ncbi:Adenosine deaminase [Trichostrongylus colubriformis]|uniref:Adenosine deaminase n=1 Tax=Trichostrongylus colubriformis TaxID=6319 RepID=A0AAN8FPQ8_TRICO
MDEVFKIFPLIHSLTTSRQALTVATKDVIKEFRDDGVIYLELRSTPKSTSEMSKREYVETVIDGILQSSRDSGIVVKLMLSVDRRQSIEESQETVDIAAADKSGVIVGIDLSGDPSVDGRNFIPVLQQARAAGLKVSVHLAEVLSGLKEVDQFLVFRPDRIGHGTYLHTDETFVEQVVSQRIPLGLKKIPLLD